MSRALWSGPKEPVSLFLEATCRLVESPPKRVLLVIGYPDVFQCADRVPEIMQHKPIGLEGFDGQLVHFSRRKGVNPEGLGLLPEGGGWLMAEFGGETHRRSRRSGAKMMACTRARRKSAGHAAAD